MTESRDFKRLVRKRMAETGESYTVARAHFDAPPKQVRAQKAATVAAFRKQIFGRRRADDLTKHLHEHYGIDVSLMTELDAGVYRLDRNGDRSWVARLFPAARSTEAVRGDAEILAYLAESGVPAERLAHADPVSVHAGQPVLVTEWVPGTNRRHDRSEATMRRLGSMLGRLHALPDGPGACGRPAGSWHTLSFNGGSRRNDVDVLLMLVSDAEKRIPADERPLMHTIRQELESLDDLEDLPHALTHPDACGANLVAADDDEGVLVDWTGAGHGPRIASVAILLGSLGAMALVDTAVMGYREHVQLDPEELGRLERALIVFPFVLDCWSLLFQGASAREVIDGLDRHKHRAAAIAARARLAFEAPLEPAAAAKDPEDQGTLF